MFFPSDRVFRSSTPAFERNLNDQLLSRIRELAGPEPSMSRQLASAHAVMRSIVQEYVTTIWVPDIGIDRNRASSLAYFTYFLPQLRFAPACVFCLIWWYSIINVTFSHELATNRYELRAVHVLHAGLKG